VTDDPFTPLTPATANGGSTRRHRHIWIPFYSTQDVPVVDGIATLPDGRTVASTAQVVRYPYISGSRCLRCDKVRDETRARRGKSARRLGGDQERAFEREHGPTKIGERGDPVDHIGRLGKYQVKSTRGEIPARLRRIARMDGLYGDRTPILVERFVHAGRKTETFLTVRLADWQAIHGRDEE
jgi:hypothetical protein